MSSMKKGLDYVFKSDSPKHHTTKPSNTRRHSGSEGGRRNSWFGSSRGANDSIPSTPHPELTNQNDNPRNRQEDCRPSFPVQSASDIIGTNVERSRQGRESYGETLTSPPTTTRASTGCSRSSAENSASATPMALHPDPGNSRKPYHGLFRKLVYAFDVGTTFSGASYAILDPGQVPEIQGVTRYRLYFSIRVDLLIIVLDCDRFPAQAKVGGDCKIPSIIYYDQQGNVRAVGAETMDEAFLEKAEDEGFIKVEWYVSRD
jgi:hypothetical protein